VTSQRAVEAWGRAGEAVEAEGAVGAGKGKGKVRDAESEFIILRPAFEVKERV